ncbi:MAG: hypothetical protein B7Y56_02845 [Gallionellales bacterium 35-53-114]|jgi:hypothetical protein|nr:MAG: hypothetical protein B7Y56_02845 [Gallionellales bacterium 35-53-114]OYZ65046.1 MAG: hypothetical protein B7Y04_00005 [Gallionellales bacterium 24-53-125]OZB07954.1 MAG: hypothetical protein B7X61_10455 [Gallionellales bacterium 39-52-133]HQS59691.1 hypothetical protein [Gallionellaceae bacterium]HQS76445.1 hypothetical protein [Gallionellaceae bacterium]
MKSSFGTKILLMATFLTCALIASVEARELSAKEHFEIGERYLSQDSRVIDATAPQFGKAIEHIKTAIASGLSYEQTGRANFLLSKYASDNLKADERFKLGQSLIEANHYDSAGSTQEGMEEGIRQMKEAIRHNCSDQKRANVILAHAYVQMLNPPDPGSDAGRKLISERTELFRRLYLAYPDDLAILDLYASWVADEKEKFVVYSHIKELDPGLSAPRYMLGLLLIKDGKIDSGIKEIGTWISLEKASSSAGGYSRVVVEYLAAQSCVLPGAEMWMDRFMDIGMAMENGDPSIRDQGIAEFKMAKQEFAAALNNIRCKDANP